jgi:hypothetical protein
MATLAREYRVHGDGAGRDEEERSGERNSYRGAVEWMKVEVSWGRLLRGHSRGGLHLLQLEAFLQFLRPFRGSADALHNCRLSQGSLADRLFLQFSRRWQVAGATIKGEGR